MIITNGTLHLYRTEAVTDPGTHLRRTEAGATLYRGACQWRHLTEDSRTPTPPTTRETATLEVLIPHDPTIPLTAPLALEVRAAGVETIAANVFRVEHLHLVDITRLTATVTATRTPKV